MAAADARPRVARVGTSVSLNRILRYQLASLSDRGWEIVCVCDGDEWAEGLRELGLPVIPLGMGRRPGPLAALRWGVSFYRLLRRERFTIVHTHNAFHGIAGRIAARCARVPIVVQTVHNWYYLDPPDALRARVYLWLERLAGLASSAVLFLNSDDFARAAHNRIVPSRRRAFIGNGIDVAGFAAAAAAADGSLVRNELGIPEDALLVTMMARLEYPKDHDTFLRAFADIAAGLPAVRALLLGYGLQRPRIDALVDELGLADRVIVEDHRDDVPAVMRASDLFVLSSYREGFGRSLVEAMVAGVPVIGSDVAGIRDVIEDGVNGFRPTGGDPQALAERMRQLLGDADLRRDVAQRARVYAMEKFDESHPIGRIDAVYRELIARRH